MPGSAAGRTVTVVSGSQALEIDVEQGTPGVVLHLAGDLDLLTAGRLVSAAKGVLADGGRGQELVVDLAGVDFCDSAGISALVRVRSLSARHDCVLRATNPRPQVRRILEVTGLTAHLNLG